ncbi:hypothetical protein [Paraflavitalea sp. CAU 1676]|uniref:hypothetical protein n=1 Tax=Paraflavitalea sp. CAU 1676 TaxID=3032598 RepID=UPI0023DBFBB3|nr:hypothetical protein [Paraflavitalea sp. CAU 1676]MDF2190958.1 hypothetical protein [Paraflavitalea sp. CAU 1676]
MWNRTKVYLSSRVASVICFIIAILGKIILLKVFLTIGADKMGQIAITRNFLQGHGLRLLASSPTDISSSSYIWNNGWPPGYNLLLSLFLSPSGFNYVQASFVTDCVAALLFFWYCRKVLLMIDFPIWTVNLFLLFQSFFLFKYLQRDPVTDFLSLSLMVAAMYYVLKVVKECKVSINTIAWLSFFLLAASSMRYQNFPACLFLAGALTFIGWFQKQPSWSTTGCIAVCFLIFCFGGFLVYQHFQAGKAYYLVPVRNGFFPSNLLYMDPYVFTAFVNVHFLAVQASKANLASYTTCAELVRWTAIPLGLLFTLVAGRHFIKTRFRIRHAQEGFFFFGFITYLSIVGLLVLLSLRLDINIGPPLFRWTYVMNARYYAFPIFYVQVCLWWYLFVRPVKHGNLWLRWLKVLFLGLMTFEALHGAYFTIKHCNRDLFVFRDTEIEKPEQALLTQFVKESQARDPDRKIVVASYFSRIRFLADLYGVSTILDIRTLSHQMPLSSKPAVLLAVLSRSELQMFEKFIHEPGVKLLSQTKDYYLYTYYVEPSGTKQ